MSFRPQDDGLLWYLLIILGALVVGRGIFTRHPKDAKFAASMSVRWFMFTLLGSVLYWFDHTFHPTRGDDPIVAFAVFFFVGLLIIWIVHWVRSAIAQVLPFRRSNETQRGFDVIAADGKENTRDDDP
jgi:hypothetical protein